MTISTTVVRDVVDGVASQISHTTTFKGTSTDQVLVFDRTKLTGASVPVTVGNSAGQCSITGGGTPPSTFLVTSVSNVAATHEYVIYRVSNFQQEVNFQPGGRMSSAALEQALDALAMQTQELAEYRKRSLHVGMNDVTGPNDTETMELPAKATRASKMMSFGTDGEVTVTDPSAIGGNPDALISNTPGGATVSALADTVLVSNTATDWTTAIGAKVDGTAPAAHSHGTGLDDSVHTASNGLLETSALAESILDSNTATDWTTAINAKAVGSAPTAHTHGFGDLTGAMAAGDTSHALHAPTVTAADAERTLKVNTAGNAIELAPVIAVGENYLGNPSFTEIVTIAGTPESTTFFGLLPIGAAWTVTQITNPMSWNNVLQSSEISISPINVLQMTGDAALVYAATDPYGIQQDVGFCHAGQYMLEAWVKPISGTFPLTLTARDIINSTDLATVTTTAAFALQHISVIATLPVTSNSMKIQLEAPCNTTGVIELYYVSLREIVPESFAGRVPTRFAKRLQSNIVGTFANEATNVKDELTLQLALKRPCIVRGHFTAHIKFPAGAQVNAQVRIQNVAGFIPVNVFKQISSTNASTDIDSSITGSFQFEARSMSAHAGVLDLDVVFTSTDTANTEFWDPDAADTTVSAHSLDVSISDA